MPKFNTTVTCAGRGGHCTTGVALERDVEKLSKMSPHVGLAVLEILPGIPQLFFSVQLVRTRSFLETGF